MREYVGFDNIDVSVGLQKLIPNSYESRTSKLLQSKYGNGQIVKNNYDEYNRVIGKSVIEGTVSNPIERSL